MILGPARDQLDPRTRSVLLSVAPLGRGANRQEWSHATTARSRWYDAGCPDVLTPDPCVAGVLLTSADLERRQRAWLEATDLLTWIGLDDHGRAPAIRRLMTAVDLFLKPEAA